MPKRPPLTKAKEKWAENRNVALNGSPLRYNASVQEKYISALESLVKIMTANVKKALIKLFKDEAAKDYFKSQKEAAAMDESISSQARILMNKLKKKFDVLFNLKSGALSEKMVKQAQQTSKTNLHASLEKLSGGLSLKTGIVSEGLEEVAKASVAENVSLIKSIPAQYFNDVTGSVMRAITTGNGMKDLLPALTKYEGITTRRARNIALDQTRKAYNQINKQRLLKIGVKQFKWIHSGGGQHPRKSHQALHGKIFSFDDLPIINQEQVAKGYEAPVRGIPGDAINCKCVMNPVVKFGEE